MILDSVYDGLKFSCVCIKLCNLSFSCSVSMYVFKESKTNQPGKKLRVKCDQKNSSLVRKTCITSRSWSNLYPCPDEIFELVS